MLNFSELNYLNFNNNALYNYLLSGTFYEFTTSVLMSFPLFWVWVASIVVWFFLELSTFLSNFFNNKHSYLNNVSRLNILSNYSVMILNNHRNLSSFLKKAVNYYL
jgi:hypothetical protein